MENGFTVLPTTTESSFERIELEGIYLIDNSEYIYVYVLKEADPETISLIFGVETFEEIATLSALPLIPESDYSVRVNNMVD